VSVSRFELEPYGSLSVGLQNNPDGALTLAGKTKEAELIGKLPHAIFGARYVRKSQKQVRWRLIAHEVVGAGR
jgi:hypothetical protein